MYFNVYFNVQRMDIKEKQLKFLQLLEGKSMHIEAAWGLTELNGILLNSLMVDNPLSYYKEIKESQLNLDFITDSGQTFQTTYDQLPESKGVAVMSINGVMTAEDGLCNYGMRHYESVLRGLYANDNVSSIVIRLNSGGGEVTAGDILMNAIKDKNKPVIIHTSLMCSAALRGSLYADEIIATSSSARIGSIGVMLSIPKVALARETSEEEGTLTMYSEKSPNKNKSFRELLLGNDSEFIKELTALDDAFMAEVQANRTLKGSEKTIEETLSGGVWVATKAKRRGLIDSIGTFNTALRKARSHSKYYK